MTSPVSARCEIPGAAKPVTAPDCHFRKLGTLPAPAEPVKHRIDETPGLAGGSPRLSRKREPRLTAEATWLIAGNEHRLPKGASGKADGVTESGEEDRPRRFGRDTRSAAATRSVPGANSSKSIRSHAIPPVLRFAPFDDVSVDSGVLRTAIPQPKSRTAMIIDAHQHFWKLDLPFNYEWLRSEPHQPICRDYMPSDLQPLLEKCGIDRSVFVQTQHDVAENRWVLGLAEKHDFIAGVVGWVDLASPDCEAQLEEFKAHPKFVGVRHIVHDEPDDDFIVRPEILNGLRVLEKHAVPYDLLFFHRHLRHAPLVASAVPDLPLVIDHLSKPKIKAGEMEAWRSELKAAGRHPNMYCKISGMVTEADWKNWKTSDLRPYVETALEVFGPERCMYGSDWPVCELAGEYEEVWNAANELISSLGEDERAAVLGGTAEKFYGLKS